MAPDPGCYPRHQMSVPLPTPPQLQRALGQRAHLPTQGTTFFRAMHTTESAGLLALDIAASLEGHVGILSLYQALGPAQEQQLAQMCAEVCGLDSLYLKRRPREARHLANVERHHLAPEAPLLGKPTPELTVLEEGVPYLLRPGGDLSVGLFGDARPARAWLRAHAAGVRVLNTFAYTCGFGLNAAHGGAAGTTNLDLSRRVLDWGRQNYALSGLTGPQHDYIYGDTFDWLGRLARRGERYGVVVLDPPSFARSKRGTWRSERDYAQLLQAAAQVTAPGGTVLALCNHAGVGAAQFEKMLRQGAQHSGRPLEVLAQLGAGEDYPGAQHLKVRALRLR